MQIITMTVSIMEKRAGTLKVTPKDKKICNMIVIPELA